MSKRMKLILLMIMMSVILFMLAGCANTTEFNSTRTTILSKENCQELCTKFLEDNKDSNDIWYFKFVYVYYAKESFDNSLTSDEQEEKTYQRLCGKTINELVNEGKELMKEYNMTIEEFKKDLEESELLIEKAEKATDTYEQNKKKEEQEVYEFESKFDRLLENLEKSGIKMEI